MQPRLAEKYTNMVAHLGKLRELTHAPYAASIGWLRQLKDDDKRELFAKAAVEEVVTAYWVARTELDEIVKREQRMFQGASGRRRMAHLLRAICVRIPEDLKLTFNTVVASTHGEVLGFAVVDKARMATDFEEHYKRLEKRARHA